MQFCWVIITEDILKNNIRRGTKMKYLVLDIGGSAIKYALMTEELEFIEKGKKPTPRDNIEHFIETVGGIYDEYKDDIKGMAISMPGVLDSKKGYAYTGGFINLQ
jgi:predicted NBD/HSP70 family sugar kinase